MAKISDEAFQTLSGRIARRSALLLVIRYIHRSRTKYKLAKFDDSGDDPDSDAADYGDDAAFFWRHHRLRSQIWNEWAVRDRVGRKFGCRKWDWCRCRRRSRHGHRVRTWPLGSLREMNIGLRSIGIPDLDSRATELAGAAESDLRSILENPPLSPTLSTSRRNPSG